MVEAPTPELLFTAEPSRFTERSFEELLLFCVHEQASDVTLQTERRVYAEIYGVLKAVTVRPLTNAEVGDFLNYIYGANGTAQILSGQDVDTHFELRPRRGERYRFRVNATGCYVDGHEGIQITFRTIPCEPPTLADMDLPQKLRDAVIPSQGIVIVSGATGSGKSTLLAAIIREILETQNGKILSYEAPIEYVYDTVEQRNAMISQHEIPRHLPDFPRAVRNALRRKPNYILVGEARDKETISAVIDAALTGHTVYTTVHSNGVVDTIRRMVSSFPHEERQGRAMDIVMLVRAIVWQTLLPSKQGKRVPLREWLVFNDNLRDKLLECSFS